MRWVIKVHIISDILYPLKKVANNLYSLQRKSIHIEHMPTKEVTKREPNKGEIRFLK